MCVCVMYTCACVYVRACVRVHACVCKNEIITYYLMLLIYNFYTWLIVLLCLFVNAL